MATEDAIAEIPDVWTEGFEISESLWNLRYCMFFGAYNLESVGSPLGTEYQGPMSGCQSGLLSGLVLGVDMVQVRFRYDVDVSMVGVRLLTYLMLLSRFIMFLVLVQE